MLTAHLDLCCSHSKHKLCFLIWYCHCVRSDRGLPCSVRCQFQSRFCVNRKRCAVQKQKPDNCQCMLIHICSQSHGYLVIVIPTMCAIAPPLTADNIIENSSFVRHFGKQCKPISVIYSLILLLLSSFFGHCVASCVTLCARVFDKLNESNIISKHIGHMYRK